MINILNASVPVTLQNIHQVCQPYGQVNKIITFSKGSHFNALVEMGTAQQAGQARSFLDGKDMFQGCCHLQVSFSNRQGLVVRQNNHKSWDYTSGMMQQGAQSMLPSNPQELMALGGGAGMGMDQGSPVVIVSQINQATTSNIPVIQQLFTLFGVYGDVIRVKILFAKRDTALIQFTTGQQAQLAATHLNDAPFNGQVLKVNLSRHMEVSPTTDGKDAEGTVLQMEFGNSPLHRYKNKRFMNLKNVNPPSLVLHVANVDPEMQPSDLATLFGTVQTDLNLPVPQVEFFKDSKQMAYVCMPSIPNAVSALVQFHGYQLGRYPIRVSFSRRDPARQMQQAQQMQFPMQMQPQL